MPAPTPASSSSRAPTPSPSTAWTPRSSAPCACVEAGADGIFAEAAYDLPTYQRFVDAVKVPVLANITEFGQTPLFTARRTGLGRRRHPAVPAVGVPGHEQGGRELSTPPSAATATRRPWSIPCRRARNSTTASATTPTSSKPRRAVRREEMMQRTSTMSENTTNLPKAKKSVALSGTPRRQHRAVHRRPQRQRPALPRLRHPRPGHAGRLRGSRAPAGARRAADRQRS